MLKLCGDLLLSLASDNCGQGASHLTQLFGSDRACCIAEYRVFSGQGQDFTAEDFVAIQQVHPMQGALANHHAADREKAIPWGYAFRVMSQKK